MIIAELWMKISLTVMSVCCGSAVFAQDKYQTSVSAQSQRALLTAKSELKLGLDGKGVVKLQQLAQAQPKLLYSRTLDSRLSWPSLRRATSNWLAA